MVVISDLNKNIGGSTLLAKKRQGSADLRTPIHPRSFGFCSVLSPTFAYPGRFYFSTEFLANIKVLPVQNYVLTAFNPDSIFFTQ